MRIGGAADVNRLRPLMAGLLVAVALAACVAVPVPQRDPVPAGPLGPVIAAPDGGPPIECRGIPQDRCREVGTVRDGEGGVAQADIVRVIVTCEGAPCTLADGAFRIDILLKDGSTIEHGSGGYGSAPAVQP
jgi:hypothetical protein